MNSGTRMLAGIAVGAGLLLAAPGGARAQDEPQGGSPGGCRTFGQFVASQAGRAWGEQSSDLARRGLTDVVVHGLQSAACDTQS